MRKRRWLWFSTGLVFAAALLNCDVGGGDWVQDAGEWVADAGQVVVDAGRSLRDGGELLQDSGVANAQMEYPCLEHSRRRITSANGGWTETVSYMADLGPGTPQDVVDSLVVVCGPQSLRPDPGCPEGATCTGTEPVATECSFGAVNLGVDGRLRVGCGSSTETDTLGLFGSRWTRVLVQRR